MGKAIDGLLHGFIWGEENLLLNVSACGEVKFRTSYVFFLSSTSMRSKFVVFLVRQPMASWGFINIDLFFFFLILMQSKCGENFELCYVEEFLCCKRLSFIILE